MNIFNKVALQGLKKSRTRTFVTVMGVVLSVALITAVATFAVSLQNYLIKGAEQKYGDWNVEVSDADSLFVLEQTGNNRVSDIVTIQNIGYAVLDGGQNPDKPYLFVTGWDEDAFSDIPVNLISGRLPENNSEIMIPTHVAANGGVRYAVGDTLTLAVGVRSSQSGVLSQHDSYAYEDEKLENLAEKTYTVVGIYQRPAFEERTAPGYTLITTVDAAAASDDSTVFLTLAQPYKVRSYMKSLEGSYGCTLNNEVMKYMGLSEDKMFNTLLYSVVGILIVLVMIGSVFLIYNSFHISLSERTHQFGILMSVGATEKQLRGSVLFEGFCIGLIGIPIGILAGIPSIKLVLSLLEKNFTSFMYGDVPLALVISVPAIVIAAVISLITILISAYIPAKKAAMMPIMECIRQTNDIKVSAKAVRTSKLAERLYGLEGTLALKNFKRNKKRYRSIIMSLTLSVVLFVSAASFRTCLQQISGKSKIELDNDICLYAKGIDDEDLSLIYDNIKGCTGVYKSAYQAVAQYSCEADTSDLTSDFLNNCKENGDIDGADGKVKLMLDIQFVEEDVYQEYIRKLGISDDSQRDKIPVIGTFGEKDVMFSNDSAELTISSKEGGQTKRINAVFVADSPLGLFPADTSVAKEYVFTAIAPYQMKAQFDELKAETRQGILLWSENPGQTTKQIREIMDGWSADTSYTLYNYHELMEQYSNTSFILDVFTSIFIVMITLIAVANVFNTITTNIKLRRRELAMLRSVGISDRGFNKMMRFECVLYGMKTMLLGIPVSILASWLICEGLDGGGGDISFVFPWAGIGISILGVFFVIFITMVYSVNKIKKENIIDALRDDMN